MWEIDTTKEIDKKKGAIDRKRERLIEKERRA